MNFLSMILVAGAEKGRERREVTNWRRNLRFFLSRAEFSPSISLSERKRFGEDGIGGHLTSGKAMLIGIGGSAVKAKYGASTTFLKKVNAGPSAFCLGVAVRMGMSAGVGRVEEGSSNVMPTLKTICSVSQA